MSFVTLMLFLICVINIGTALNRLIFGRELDGLGTCCAVALGFLVIGLIGVVAWVTPIGPRKISIALLVLGNLAAAWTHWRRGWPVLQREGAFGLSLWVFVSLVLLVIAQLPIPQPAKLPDGSYVYKQWTLPVRVQVLAGDLPPDNAIPAFVTEYIARHVPFTEQRPLMPGEEVSNRPILQALMFLPFRLFLSHDNDKPDPYPTFSYVGSTWPDTSQLVSDEVFADFLGIAIPCDSALLLALGAMLTLFGCNYRGLALIVFAPLSPYFLQHAIFTWPKNLAAFFIVTAVLLLEHQRLARRMSADASTQSPSTKADDSRSSSRPIYPASALWAALFIGLAYWAHPYGLAFVVTFALVCGIDFLLKIRKRPAVAWFDTGSSPWRAFGSAGLVLAVVAPWTILMTFVLKIHSDLVAQNFNGAAPLGEMIWARLANFFLMLFPTVLTQPFNRSALMHQYIIHLISAVGVVPFFFLATAIVRYAKLMPYAVLWLGVIPGLMLFGAFGSYGAVPLMHGWQAVWPVLVAASLVVIRDEMGRRAVLATILVQGAVNIALLAVKVGQFL